VGRVWMSANRNVPMAVASLQRRHMIPQIGINSTNMPSSGGTVHVVKSFEN
jgi:hypothetical protein